MFKQKDIRATYKTDVLIIGGGGAALRAALAAFESGADVLIVSKGRTAQSGATYFSVAEIGAFNVPNGSKDPQDNPDWFYKDIMDAALGVADPKLARILADEAMMAQQYLEQKGMEFARDENGNYMVYQACFSNRPRSHVVKNHFKPVVKALGQAVLKAGIRCLDQTTVIDLLTVENTVCGAVAMDETGQLILVQAKTVVLTTGGGSTLFKHNMYPSDITGDGYVMAKRAGAMLSNMEFIQAGIGLAWPQINLFGNQLWPAIPSLTNGNHEPFLKTYIPENLSVQDVITTKGRHFPFSTRDSSKYIEIAVVREITDGHPTEHGNVYLDFIHTDFDQLLQTNRSFADTWPITLERFKSFGIDLYHEPIEIACFAHCINGGIVIDENAESTVKNLFAAGETASGPHGADRLGGNMSVTCQVFGRRAGNAAAQKASAQSAFQDIQPALEKSLDFLNSIQAPSTENVSEMLEMLQNAADRSLLIVRNEQGMKKFRDLTHEIKASITGGSSSDQKDSFLHTVELYNLCSIGEYIAGAALERKESRGSHYRDDYPDTDDRFAHRIWI